MVGAVEDSGTKTATEINVKTQGQMTRLAMIVDTINQDLIIPNVEKVAKLCADFKSGVETIFVSNDNKQEYIEVDDSVRQGDYKYTYSDNSSMSVKSEQADFGKSETRPSESVGMNDCFAIAKQNECKRLNCQ